VNIPAELPRLPACARPLMLFAAAATLAGCEGTIIGPGSGLLTDATRALALGAQHACVLTERGEAFCWGTSSHGQLGMGSRDISSVPVPVAGGHRFVAIHAGGRHTCALTADGDAYCWGDNGFGQLGDGTSSQALVPTPVAGGLKFAALSVGGWTHTCGRATDGRLFCWGSDQDGQLGLAAPETCIGGSGEIPCSRTPREVALGGTASAVDAGFFHTCALRTGGVATCWGNNVFGQMGSGSTGDRVPPTDVAGPVRFGSVSAGAVHTCGLDANGSAYCWGNGFAGALGVGGVEESLMPIAVSGGLTFRQISASKGNSILTHTCAVRSDGSAYCWGSDTSGQLGGGGATEICGSAPGAQFPCSTTPGPVSGAQTWAVIRTGTHFTCGIDTTGAAFCWGLNEVGQLGNATMGNAATPQAVSGGLRLPRG
jgi:alpha-tubulin suppressor-like RCC1 family protein